jgi:hypothetical protein
VDGKILFETPSCGPFNQSDESTDYLPGAENKRLPLLLLFLGFYVSGLGGIYLRLLTTGGC